MTMTMSAKRTPPIEFRRRRGRTGKIDGKPDPIDIHVGARIRLRRTMLGMSQEKLGDAIGLTFQQVQKYERGTNRVGASRLHDIAGVLDVPIQYFFDEISAETKARVVKLRAGITIDHSDEDERDPLAKRETLELVRAYYKIENPKVRKRLFEMTKSLGAGAAISAAAE